MATNSITPSTGAIRALRSMLYPTQWPSQCLAGRACHACTLSTHGRATPSSEHGRGSSRKSAATRGLHRGTTSPLRSMSTAAATTADDEESQWLLEHAVPTAQKPPSRKGRRRIPGLKLGPAAEERVDEPVIGDGRNHKLKAEKTGQEVRRQRRRRPSDTHLLVHHPALTQPFKNKQMSFGGGSQPPLQPKPQAGPASTHKAWDAGPQHALTNGAAAAQERVTGSQHPPSTAAARRSPDDMTEAEAEELSPLPPAQQEKFESCFSEVLQVKRHKGNAEAADVLASTLLAWADTGNPKDWTLTERLYAICCYHIDPAEMRRARDSVVTHLLSQTPPRYEAISLLCRRLDSDVRLSYRHIRTYLAAFTDQRPALTVLYHETRKILHGMQSLGIPLSADVVLPYIRNLTMSGYADTAKLELDALAKDFDLEPSIPVCVELVKAYAANSQWASIDDIFSELHEKGVSRERPENYATLLRFAVNLFALHNRQPEDVYDFVLYTMHHGGVVPSSGLTAELIKVFILHQRFDLIARFMRQRQEHFPQLRIPTEAPLAVSTIAGAWAQVSRHVRLPNMLNTCTAIARGAVRLPFHPELRYLILDFIKNDLLKQTRQFHKDFSTHALSEQLHVYLHQRNFKDCAEVFTYLKLLLQESLALRGRSRNAPVRRWTLTDALQTAEPLALMVEDYDAYVRRYGMPRASEAHAPSEEFDQFPTIQATQFRYQSMHIDQIIREVDEKIHTLEKLGMDFSRAPLDTAIDALSPFLREYELMKLLQHFHRSRHSAKIFDTRKYYELWLRAAMSVKDSAGVIEVLWAVIDATEEVQISALMLVLIRIAQGRLLWASTMYQQRKIHPDQHHEIEYLKNRIYRLHWRQRGCPPAEELDEFHLQEWRWAAEKAEAAGTMTLPLAEPRAVTDEVDGEHR